MASVAFCCRNDRSLMHTLNTTSQASCAALKRSSLQQTSIFDFLELDPRPTFVVDVGSAPDPIPFFWNAALSEVIPRGDLGVLLGLDPEDGSFGQSSSDSARFRDWFSDEESNHSSPFTFSQYEWIKIMISHRWAFICGVRAVTASNQRQHEKGLNTDLPSPNEDALGEEQGFDWTNENPPERMTAHIGLARSTDWGSTPLGPMSGWSPQLKSIANIVMRDTQPAVVFCGKDLNMIYNEPYVDLLGELKSRLGGSAREAFPSVWSEHFDPLIERNLKGETIETTNSPIHMARNGYMEEMYFSWRFIPIIDSAGSVMAHYEPLIETTNEVIAERRAATVLQLSEEVSRARNSDHFWDVVLDVLSRNPKDIPFIALYSTESKFFDDNSSRSSNRMMPVDEFQDCTLRGLFGLPDNSPAAPQKLDHHTDSGFMPYFRKAMIDRNVVEVDLSEGAPAADLVRGITWKGYGDPCRAAIICPITPVSSNESIMGYMVLGLNPRRPYDDVYRHFILVMARLLSTSLTSMLLHEEDIHRRERAIENAEIMKDELTLQLAATQKEVERSALKFKRFAERADIGIFIVGTNGIYSYRNDAWWRILDPNYDNRDIQLDDAWDALIDDEYISLGQEKFRTLTETRQHQSFELRLKETWEVPIPTREGIQLDREPKWILVSIQPELSEHGEMLEIVGWFQDISQQKRVEKLQALQADHARESKRKLENFIDTTSHEMRNPLSAILQCADSIKSSHTSFQQSANYTVMHRDFLNDTLEAADTIVQCSKHMKTIVDDVLTMSKLDSGLFVMTPVDVQLESIARDAVKMFEGEAKAAGVRLDYHAEDSCTRSDVDYVSLDPTRVLQILINLITNAIKFTKLEKTRCIGVKLGVSFEEPLGDVDQRIRFHRTPGAEESIALQADWEKGDVLYMMFSVHDTGRGLSESEQELLFARFSQASPRTHIDYGGSGLGLFISRRLTELHGGAIGFASKAKVGSIFSFYVKCRKSQAPNAGSPHESPSRYMRITNTRPISPPKGMWGNSEPRERVCQDEPLKILIVEDNLVNQRVLAKQLRKIGMEVAVANHGGEALEYLLSTSYCDSDLTEPEKLSLILLDWEMPVMDGLTCVREIRSLQNQGIVKGHVPVIAVTANVRSEQVIQALDAGMDDVISKPFRIPELCAIMQKAISTIAQRS